MKFEEAAKELKSGKQIKRKVWKRTYLRLADKTTGESVETKFDEKKHYFQFHQEEFGGNAEQSLVFSEDHPDRKKEDWIVVGSDEDKEEVAKGTKKAE